MFYYGLSSNDECLYCSVCLTAVSVGFQTPLSRVSEDTGRVLVTVELDSPSDVPFTVLLTTQDNSATGANVCVNLYKEVALFYLVCILRLWDGVMPWNETIKCLLQSHYKQLASKATAVIYWVSVSNDCLPNVHLLNDDFACQAIDCQTITY